jgi:hypothetical protein
MRDTWQGHMHIMYTFKTVIDTDMYNCPQLLKRDRTFKLERLPQGNKTAKAIYNLVMGPQMGLDSKTN